MIWYSSGNFESELFSKCIDVNQFRSCKYVLRLNGRNMMCLKVHAMHGTCSHFVSSDLVIAGIHLTKQSKVTTIIRLKKERKKNKSIEPQTPVIFVPTT